MCFNNNFTLSVNGELELVKEAVVNGEVKEAVVNGGLVKEVVVDDSISFANFKISGWWTNQLHTCNWLVIVPNSFGRSEDINIYYIKDI